MEPAHSGWNVVQMLNEAGASGYAIVLLALLAAGFGMVAATVAGLGPKSAGPVLATLALVGTSFVLASGLVSERYLLGKVHDVLGAVSACDRDTLLYFGSHEARQCLRLALLLAIVPGFVSVIAAAIAVVRSEGGFGLVAGGVVLGLAAVGADLAMLNRPYEGRELHGVARDVLCKVLQADPLTESCATDLAEATDADVATIRALPEYDPKKVDACVALTLSRLKPESPEEAVDAVQRLSQARLLDDAQRQRCADALVARKEALRQKIAASGVSLPVGQGSIADVLEGDDAPAGGLGSGGVGIGAGPGARTLNPESDFRKHEHDQKGQVGVGSASSVGGLDHDVIRRVVRAHGGEQRFCYEKALKHDPSISGKLVVTFTIAPSGDVTSVRVGEDSTLKDAELRACMVGRLQRMKFPTGAGVTTVTYPFDFRISE